MRVTIVTFITFFLATCTRNLKPDAYIGYFEKHRKQICRTITRNEVCVRIWFQPAEIYAARAMVADPELKAHEALERYKNTLYFVIAVSSEKYGGASPLLMQDGPDSYSSNLKYNTGCRSGDIFLCKGNDTLRMADYCYEKNWGVGADDAFLVAFRKSDGSIADMHLIIRNLTKETGTIDIPINKLIQTKVRLRG